MFRGELYPFQKDIVDRMVERRQILVAADLGTGKTVESLAACERLAEDGVANSVLLVVPASLKHQWRRAILQFTDSSVLLVAGTPKKRADLYIQVGHYRYVLVNYEQVVNDFAIMRLLKFDVIVVDEASALRGFRTKRTRCMKKMSAPYKFALTGQPVENRPEEVFSIMGWVDPEVLGDFRAFDSTFIARNSFGGVQYYKNLPTLHKRLSEAMVRKRRDDPDVVASMPKVVVEELLVELGSPSAALYRTIATDLLTELQAAAQNYGNFDVFRHYSPTAKDPPGQMAAAGAVMARLLALRMLCDHPGLLAESADAYRAGSGGSKYAADLLDVYRGNVSRFPTEKFCATLDQIDEILGADPANKIVLFSFFKGMIRRFSMAARAAHNAVLYTGDLTLRQRNANKERFAADSACRLLLSSDAGGVGLDIPEAKFLINYDLPFSGGKFAQRQGRIVRLSSAWDCVTLITMMVSGSIEERMYDQLTAKSQIADAIVDGRGIDRKGRLKLNVATLTTFLQNSGV